MRSQVDHYLYLKLKGKCFIYVVLYVDATLLMGKNMGVIKKVKMQLSSKFDMKDLDAAHFIFGMEITRDHTIRKLWINEEVR